MCACFSQFQPVFQIFRYQLSVLQSDSALTLSIQNSHKPHGLRAQSHKTPSSTSGTDRKTTHFWLTGYKIGRPHNSLFRFDSFARTAYTTQGSSLIFISSLLSVLKDINPE